MKVIIQRVTKVSVTIHGNIKSSIGSGLLILLGIEDADTDEDIEWLSAKIVNLRIFNDEKRSNARLTRWLSSFGRECIYKRYKWRHY